MIVDRHQSFAIHLQAWVNFGAFVAAGNQNCGTIAGADIGQRHDHVDLPDHPFTGVVVAKGEILQRCMSAAVDVEEAAGRAYIEKIFVDRNAVDGIDIFLR